MADHHTACEPLLHNGSSKKTTTSSFVPIAIKWVLKTAMWTLFLIWAAVPALYPTAFMQTLLGIWMGLTTFPIFGITGSLFLLFGGPVLIIAFIAFFYVSFFSHDCFEKKKVKFPKFRLWTFPVLIDGPLGVVSAAELIWIVLFAASVLWSITFYLIQNDEDILGKGEPSYRFLESMGLRFGTIGIFCLSFLFLPVSRGSILLRLIDIPFEHAAKYHVWLGHLTMFLFTIHGLLYITGWSMQGKAKLVEKISEWTDVGISNLPGVISLTAGLLMWVTSLKPMRNNYFELFFYTHQLYVIFIVFLALHVGDFIFSFAAGPIFLFIMDRFLRFCQSRTTVDIISAASHPCGTVELILKKPANLPYNALSFIFLQIRECSLLEWHPFSVSSSPLDGKNHVSVLIKVLGGWTEQLKDMSPNVLAKNQVKSHRITASVEGPYGHESPYHLMYENLILVAGGIGISPFVAILSDILHRIREGKPCSPKNVLVVWSVKKSDELCLLSAVNAQPVSSTDTDKINIDIQAYVTQESEPSLEEGKPEVSARSGCPFSSTSGNSMSGLVGTGNNMWSGIYVAVSTLGFIAIYGLLQLYYLTPYNITLWWYKGLILIVSMVAGVVIPGGIVILLWHMSEKRCSSNETRAVNGNGSMAEGDMPALHNGGAGQANLATLQTTHYGRRPDFESIFCSFGERVGHVDVGVIVCGPPGFQSSVARACRSQNIRGKWNRPVFHFNSHSFDL